MTRRTHQAIDPELCGALVELEEGRAVVDLGCTERMSVDSSGLVHGGFTFALADHAAMMAVNEPTVVLGSADTRFLKPTAVGDRIRAEAKVIEEKGRKRVVEVSCARGDEVVMSGTFTCFVPEQHVLGAAGD